MTPISQPFPSFSSESHNFAPITPSSSVVVDGEVTLEDGFDVAELQIARERSLSENYKEIKVGCVSSIKIKTIVDEALASYNEVPKKHNFFKYIDENINLTYEKVDFQFSFRDEFTCVKVALVGSAVIFGNSISNVAIASVAAAIICYMTAFIVQKSWNNTPQQFKNTVNRLVSGFILSGQEIDKSHFKTLIKVGYIASNVLFKVLYHSIWAYYISMFILEEDTITAFVAFFLYFYTVKDDINNINEFINDFNNEIILRPLMENSFKTTNDPVLQERICPLSQKPIKYPLKLPCDHLFETWWVLKWLSGKNSCPTCRHSVKQDQIVYDKEIAEIIKGRVELLIQSSLWLEAEHSIILRLCC